jgi:hypothetical protein
MEFVCLLASCSEVVRTTYLLMGEGAHSAIYRDNMESILKCGRTIKLKYLLILNQVIRLP